MTQGKALHWMTLDSRSKCGHGGRVTPQAQQRWVSVMQVPVLVMADPVGRPISDCPNIATNLVPCTVCGAVVSGPSPLVRVDGRPVVLDSLVGVTNSVAPSTYFSVDAGQSLVTEGKG